MGKYFVLGFAVAIGYAIGFRDARHHQEHIVSRAVEQVRGLFGDQRRNDFDGAMNRVEGKN
jgi:hypothetical protein